MRGTLRRVHKRKRACRAEGERDKMKTWSGGPIFLKSRGSGVDEYLLRLNPRGKWTRVICRTDSKNFWNDLAAMNFILSDHDRICTDDNAKRYNKNRDKILTLSFSEYVDTCFS